jgi:alpha,alpha-trehalase
MQYFAFAGLARCGMHEDARRIAQKYVDSALRVYKDRHSLFEKYNVQEGSSEVHVVHGYNINVSEQGTFLWTAATLKMAQDLLSKDKA